MPFRFFKCEIAFRKLVFAVFLGASSTALAQIDYGINLGSDLNGVAMMNSAIGAGTQSPSQRSSKPVIGAAAEDDMRRSAAEAARARRGRNTAAQSVVNVTTQYRSDPAVTARTRRQFLDFVRRTSGDAGANAVGSSFASDDPLASWARQAAGDGMHPGDVADALAEYWVTDWLIANNRLDAPPAQVRAVREQVRSVLGRQAFFARLTEVQRQEMAEVYIYNTLLHSGAYLAMRHKGDTATVQRLGAAAVTRFRNEMHVDLTQITLTEHGFTPKA